MRFVKYIRAFFRDLFAPSSEKLLKTKEKQKRYILMVIAMDTLRTTKYIYSKLPLGMRMSHQEFIDVLDDLVNAGLVQRLDGGNKELSPWAVCYTISTRGLNYIGLPERGGV